MKYKKLALLALLLMLVSCAVEFVERAPLPSNHLLIMAHRGASAYLPEHTIPAYELALEMGADYIEIDLHMTADNKLVALHDSDIQLGEKKQAISQLHLDMLKDYSPGAVFNELYPQFASPVYEAFSVPELSEILAHFKTDANYYIEIKNPTRTPGIEEELIRQLQAHQLLNRSDDLPKVIIQSYNAESLKKVFELEPTIPLVKLYSQKTTHISNKEMNRLLTYASGIGVNENILTSDLVNRLHKRGLHIHPFVLNEAAQIENAIELGVDGLFTDKPDVAVQIRDGIENNHDLCFNSQFSTFASPIKINCM